MKKIIFLFLLLDFLVGWAESTSQKSNLRFPFDLPKGNGAWIRYAHRLVKFGLNPSYNRFTICKTVSALKYCQNLTHTFVCYNSLPTILWY